MNRDVLLAGAWDEGPGYPRAASLRQGLTAAGARVRECRAPSLGACKQRLVRQPWRWPTAWLRQRSERRTLVAAVRGEVARQRPDVVLVPYPGHAVVQDLAAAVDVPVVLDLFLSAYDTVVEDRGIVRPGSLLAQWLRGVDHKACAAADLVLLDTAENAAYVAALTGLPPQKFTWLPVHDPCAPASVSPLPAAADGVLELLFFGTGVPLHGLDTLVRAVAAAPRVRLTLVGGTRADRAAAVRLLVDRVRLLPEFVPFEELERLLAASHLVAGVFGASGKAQRVVPFKVVHALAAGRPVVSAETPALLRWLDGSGAVFVVPAGDADALAAELSRLANEPARLIEACAAARPAYDRWFGTTAQAARWRELLARLVGRGGAAA